MISCPLVKISIKKVSVGVSDRTNTIMLQCTSYSSYSLFSVSLKFASPLICSQLFTTDIFYCCHFFNILFQVVVLFSKSISHVNYNIQDFNQLTEWVELCGTFTCVNLLTLVSLLLRWKDFKDANRDNIKYFFFFKKKSSSLLLCYIVLVFLLGGPVRLRI